MNKDGSIWVNELAPRPHNSGHHTIEANVTSQYEQHLRCILGLKPGNTDTVFHAAMVNILGSEGHSGEAHYQGMHDVLATEGAFVHLYGKKDTKPFRKMGHVTVIGSSHAQVKEKAQFVKDTLKVVSK